jgi:hypothetical protein
VPLQCHHRCDSGDSGHGWQCAGVTVTVDRGRSCDSGGCATVAVVTWWEWEQWFDENGENGHLNEIVSEVCLFVLCPYVCACVCLCVYSPASTKTRWIE